MLNWSEVLQILNLQKQLYWETMMLGLRHVFLKSMSVSSAFTATSLFTINRFHFIRRFLSTIKTLEIEILQ